MLPFLAATTRPSCANPLAPIWTGAYVGLTGGISLADVDTGNVADFDATRVGFGGHIGYNFELGNWILGIEFDANQIGSSQAVAMAAGGTASFETDWQGSLRGRLGFSFGPALIYATAGWAWTGAAAFENTTAGTAQTSDLTYHGVVYGFGAESFVLPSISLRLEALRYDYATETLSAAGGLQALSQIDMHDTHVRAGVTIHLQ